MGSLKWTSVYLNPFTLVVTNPPKVNEKARLYTMKAGVENRVLTDTAISKR